MVENKGDETIFCEDNDVLQYTFTIIEFIQLDNWRPTEEIDLY